MPQLRLFANILTHKVDRSEVAYISEPKGVGVLRSSNKKFADSEKIAVFIVLGIGSNHEDPEKIYIIPLGLLPLKDFTYDDLAVLKMGSIKEYNGVTSFRFSPESDSLIAN